MKSNYILLTARPGFEHTEEHLQNIMSQFEMIGMFNEKLLQYVLGQMYMIQYNVENKKMNHLVQHNVKDFTNFLNTYIMFSDTFKKYIISELNLACH